MVAAWVIICNHLEETKRDLALITDRKIPDWVDAVIYGTVLIFWSFTAVQVRRRQPAHIPFPPRC